MFGSEDPLEGYLSFYNRLLLRDRTGAIAIADRYAEAATMEEMFTDLFIPTLTFAQEELDRKRITQAHDHFIKDVVRELIIRFGDRNSGTPDPLKHIVAVSVAGERLSLGTLMLTQLLRSEGYSADYFTDLPEQELVAFINEVKPEAVFVSCANAGHLEQGFALLQLLSANFPEPRHNNRLPVTQYTRPSATATAPRAGPCHSLRAHAGARNPPNVSRSPQIFSRFRVFKLKRLNVPWCAISTSSPATVKFWASSAVPQNVFHGGCAPCSCRSNSIRPVSKSSSPSATRRRTRP
jgi:hypothetical protein